MLSGGNVFSQRCIQYFVLRAIVEHIFFPSEADFQIYGILYLGQFANRVIFKYMVPRTQGSNVCSMSSHASSVYSHASSRGAS